MLGFLAKVISAPIRLANVAVKVADAITDPNPGRRIQDRDPLALDEIADATERAIRGKG